MKVRKNIIKAILWIVGAFITALISVWVAKIELAPIWNKFVSISIPLWIFILLLIGGTIVIIVFLYLHIISISFKRKPDYTKYTEEIVGDVRYKWQWALYEGEYGIKNYSYEYFCNICGTYLIWDGERHHCPTCRLRRQTLDEDHLLSLIMTKKENKTYKKK